MEFESPRVSFRESVALYHVSGSVSYPALSLLGEGGI